MLHDRHLISLEMRGALAKASQLPVGGRISPKLSKLTISH